VLWGSLAIHATVAVVTMVQSRLPNSDVDNYYAIGIHPGRPYVDFAVEFPVATVETFRVLAPAAGTRERFGHLIVGANFVADLTIVAALAWGWGIEAAACYALVAAPLVDLFFMRMDLWSTAFATIAVAAWRRDRRVGSAFSIAAGAAFKLWPLAFLPLLVAPSTRRRRLAAIVAAGVAALAVLAAWLWVAGPRGLYQVLTFRGARGWEIESTVGAVWMAIDRTTLRVESGAWRIGATSGPISIALFAIGALPCLWMVWRGARAGHVGAGWAGGVSALLLCSALLSAQFSCWIAPASAVAWVEGDARIAALTALVVFFTNLVWKSFVPLIHGTTRAIATVLARNVLLAILAIDAFRLLVRAPVASDGSSSDAARQMPL